VHTQMNRLSLNRYIDALNDSPAVLIERNSDSQDSGQQANFFATSRAQQRINLMPWVRTRFAMITDQACDNHLIYFAKPRNLRVANNVFAMFMMRR